MRFSGVDPYLEEEADLILAEDRRRLGRSNESVDWLSPGQLERRREREVYNKNGVPESHLYEGLFKRAYNPNFGKRKATPPPE